jgi:hypothetical protein
VIEPDPFEQASSGGQPGERPADRIDHRHRLMQQERGREERLACAGDDVVVFGEDVLAQRNATISARQRSPDLDVRGKCEDQHRQQEPRDRRSGKDRPSGREERDERGRQEAPAKIVENFPAGDGRQRIRDDPPVFIRHGVPGPARDLPVAAHPSMQPGREREIVGRVIVDQVDVGGEPRAREGTLEQIVAEQPVLGNTPLQ